MVVDRRDGPLEVGQADGVACRTVEMFEAFGLADRLVGEALLGQRGRLLAARPGGPDAGSRAPGASRTSRTGLSEFPHVIVNQARMLAYLRDHMERSASRLEPFYGLQRERRRRSTPRRSEYPVTVTLRTSGRAGDRRDLDDPRQVRRRLRRRAQRASRSAIGRELVGDATNQSWGVMDVLAVTDFPDIRLKSAIHSAQPGQPPHHPARGRLPGPALHRAGPGQRPRDARQPERHPGEARRGREPDPAPVHASR